jgi:hypothetical protein
MTKRAFPVLLLLLLCGAAHATTYYVDPYGGGDFPTIQAAVDACADGDIVILGEGIYQGAGNRDIDFLGKAIMVRASYGESFCLIDCQGSAADPHRGFWFHSGEDTTSIVEGVMIWGGHVADNGGGLRIDGASPWIRLCTLATNYALLGVGAHCEGDATPRFEDCVFGENDAGGVPGGGRGAGLSAIGNAAPRLFRCDLSVNSCTKGGAVYLQDDAAVLFQRCTFAANRANLTGAVLDAEGGRVIFDHCTLADNSLDNPAACLYLNGSAEVQMHHSIIAFGQNQ